MCSATHAADNVIFTFAEGSQGSNVGVTDGGGALAERAAGSHLDLNINIMANKIIPFP